ncbi:MAG TPA: type II secretion system protein [Fimbriimonadaceae bacterium]
MRKRRKKGGFTLVEMLACLAFLSLAIYPMLTCITWSLKTALQTQDRMWVEGLVQDSIETQRGTALTSALTAGTTTTANTPTGMSCTVTVKTVIALVSGYTDLYSVTVTGTWTDAVFNKNQSTITLVTYMRAPHV